MIVFCVFFFFFFKQKTAYEMVSCDWSSDVCSSDLAFGLLGWESLGPQPLWRKTRCSALQRRSSSLTTPSLLSRDSPHPARAGCSHRRIMVDVLGRIDGWWKRSSTEE